MTTEKDDGDEIARLEAEEAAALRDAEQADRLAAEVLVSYESGAGDLGTEEIAEQVEAKERIARFARSNVKRAQALLVEARKRRRLRELQKIRAEVEEYSPKAGAKMASLLKSIAKSQGEFLDLAEEHNSRLMGWASRLSDLDVPARGLRPVPPAEDAGMATQYGDGQAARVFAGRRSIDLVNGVGILETLWKERTHPDAQASIIEGVASAADEEPLPDYDHFYRNASGAVFGRKDPIPSEDLPRLELTEISRAEAWGEDVEVTV